MIQYGDEETRRKIDTILRKQEENRTRKEKEIVKEYVLEAGRLYKTVKVNGEEKLLYVIPGKMRKATVINYHDQREH